MQLTVLDHRETILQRLANGDKLKHIASDLGVHRVSISRALSKDPDYQAAINDAIECRLEDCEIALDESVTLGHAAVTVAREALAHSRWRAERLLASKYGAVRQAVQVNATGSGVTVNLVSYADTAADSNTIDETPGGG